MSAVIQTAGSALVRIDLGAGKNKREGFLGVDSIAFPGVDIVHDLANGAWPWADSSVDEANASHFLEHLTNLEGRAERVTFFNELYRVLKPGKRVAGKIEGGFASVVFPHWASQRYYGDPTHKEPFSEFGFYYLSKPWRAANAPHTDIEFNPKGYSCDFDASWGYNLHAALNVRNSEYQQHAITFYKEACADIVSTLVPNK